MTVTTVTLIRIYVYITTVYTSDKLYDYSIHTMIAYIPVFKYTVVYSPLQVLDSCVDIFNIIGRNKLSIAGGHEDSTRHAAEQFL